MAAAFLLILVLVFALGKPESLNTEPLSNSKEEHAVVSVDSKDDVAYLLKTCSAGDLKPKLENQQLSRTSAFEPEGYAVSALHDMGGLLIIEYTCSKPDSDVTFRVQWVSRGEMWRIEKISRPPSMQSGDSN
jgi:hypothetical protein